MFARIAGVGSYLPGQPVTNNDLIRRGIDTSDEWIVTRTGIKSRHLAEPECTSSDLALEASRRALSSAGIEASELDLIIVATSTPDYIFPSTACLLQAKLGNVAVSHKNALNRLTALRSSARYLNNALDITKSEARTLIQAVQDAISFVNRRVSLHKDT